MRAYLRFPAILLCSLSLSGCMHDIGARFSQFSLDTPYTQDQDNTEITAESLNDYAQQGWWHVYEDEELNTFMLLAFANNPDLNQIRARLAQASALRTRTNASRLPSLNVNADRGTQNGDNAGSSDFNLSGAASFEIDLWGKNHANYTSDLLEEQASREDLYAGAISLSASIVENWLDILSLLEQADLIRRQIDINETVLSLQEKRFEMGTSSALDVLQQEETLARSQAQLPDILSAQKQAANNLSTLMGMVPYDGLRVTKKKFPAPTAIPDAGLPSELLGNRPDIEAAWLRLQSSNWAAKAAWADRLPQFDLSATYSTNATKLGSLFNTWLLDLAAQLSAPVFDGGQRKAEQIRQEALSDERFHIYRDVVLNAVNDVENSLTENIYTDQKIAALEKQLEAARRTLEQAQLSYANGSSNYINVLNSLNSTQSLEQQIATEKLAQAKSRVTLYRVLGGRSWAQHISPSVSQGIIKKIYEGH
ncbi:MAG: TolC family protein [Alphaproteobacteria bacterium]